MISKYTDMKPQMRKMTTSAEAFAAIIKGDLDIAMYSTTAPSALRQQGQDLPLRVLFCGGGSSSSTVVGYFTKPRDDIKVFTDLKGKNVFACKPGNVWACPITDALLKVNGMTRNDFKWLEYSATADSFRSVQEGRVDCIQSVAGGSTAKMAAETGLYVIPLSPKEIEAVVALNFGFLPLVWPAGMFGNTKTTPAIAAPNTAQVSKDMSDYMAYTITKTFFDNLNEFQTAQKAGEGFTREAALLQWALPYHAGAIKYYKEQGMWGADEDAKQAALLKAEGATR
jgi:TRAP transporter TAXI family solute receptor